MNADANENLKGFNAYADRNGQDMSEAVNDRANPKELQRTLKSSPDGETETARLASGAPQDDAVAETEAETPEENIRKISDPSLPKPSEPRGGR